MMFNPPSLDIPVHRVTKLILTRLNFAASLQEVAGINVKVSCQAKTESSPNLSEIDSPSMLPTCWVLLFPRKVTNANSESYPKSTEIQ